jgi:rod shape-determining protein MreD
VILVRRNTRRPWTELGMAAGLTALTVLQASWEGVLSVFGQLPDLALVLLVVWAVRSRRSAVLWAAIGVGVLADVLGGTVPGGQSAALMLAVAPAVTWRIVLFGSTLVWAVCAATAATIIYYLVFGALLSLQGLTVAADSAIAIGAYAVLLNCLLAAAVHWASDRVSDYLWPRSNRLGNPSRFGSTWR